MIPNKEQQNKVEKLESTYQKFKKQKQFSVLSQLQYNIRQSNMNITTEQLTRQLQNLSPNEIPAISSVLQLSLIFALKGVKELLLIYPINVGLLLLCLLSIIYKIVSLFTAPKTMVYWPNQHIEQHDVHIKNFKKDVREIQNESIALMRKVQVKKKQKQQKNAEESLVSQSVPSSMNSETLELSKLLQQRQNIKNMAIESMNEIKVSQTKILEKIRKYRR